MNIYFPLETQQRELTARVLFCLEAAKRGHKAFFGHKSNIFPLIPKLKRGIFMHKSIQKRKITQINELSRLGHFNCSIDEEAVMIPDEDEYFNYRCTRNCLDALDIFFTWGEKHKSIVINKYPDLKEKVVNAGNSRIDVLKDKQRYNELALRIQKRYGKFILFVTKFGRYNLKKRGFDTWAEMKLKNNPHVSDKSYQRILQSIEFEKNNMNLTMETILTISKDFPDHNILIRPHPTENIETWEDFAKEADVPNIKVVFSAESINQWLLAADHVISHNCTTSVESAILGVTSINYIPYSLETFEYDLPKVCSHTVRNYEEIKTIINSKKKLNMDEKLIQYYVHNFNQGSFTDYSLSFLEENLEQTIYDKNNEYMKVMFLPIAKLYKLIRKYLSLYFGPLRRRRGIVSQKYPGFSKQDVIDVAMLFEPKLSIQINEVWPGVFLFEKK